MTMSVTSDGVSETSHHASTQHGSALESGAVRRTRGVGVRGGSVRVTVLAVGLEVDVSVPAGIPLIALIPALTALVADHGSTPPDRGTPAVSTPAGVPLDLLTSLSDNDVRDGDVIVLHSDRDVSPPVFDDVTDAVAALGAPATWGTDDTAVALGVAMTAACVAAAWILTRSVGTLTTACTVALATVMLVVACVCVAARVPTGVGHGTRAGACILAFAAGTALVPGSDLTSDAVLGFALVATASVVTSMFAAEAGRSAFTAVTTVGVIGCVAAAVSALTPLPVPTVAAIVSGAAVLALAWAPRLSASRAGIRLPPVRIADAGRRLDDPRAEGPPTRPSDTARAAAHDSAVVDVDVVAERARIAQQYLTGYSAGLSVAAATGAVVVATVDLADRVDGARIAMASVVALLLCCRARGGVARVRAAIFVASGAVTVLATSVAATTLRPEWWMWSVSVVTGVAVGATIVGLVVPRLRLSPVVRRAAELVELAAVVSIVPLVCLVGGALSAVRGL